MKQVIVIIQAVNDPEKQFYFGPFANGDEATHWAATNCKSLDWHWEELAPVNLPAEAE